MIHIVFYKELRDILKDTRSLFTISLVSTLAGPLLLLMLSNMLSGYEKQSEKRTVIVHGIEHAPSLLNYFQRQTATVIQAPRDYENALTAKRLQEPVLVIPPSFEIFLKKGEKVSLYIVTDSTNARAQANVNRLKSWIGNFASERSTLFLALHGINTGGFDDIQLEEKNLSNPEAKASKIFGMLPFFFVMAALYGVWSSAIDTTAGEKERKTLDSLRLTPITTSDLMLGKWLAVSTIGSLIVMLTVMCFVIAGTFIPSVTLRAMFSFGLVEAIISMAILLPVVLLFASALMFIGVSAKTLKEAQTNATGFMLMVTLLPIFVQLKDAETTWLQDVIPVISHHQAFIKLLQGAEFTNINLLLIGFVTLFISGIMLTISSKRFNKQYS